MHLVGAVGGFRWWPLAAATTTTPTDGNPLVGIDLVPSWIPIWVLDGVASLAVLAIAWLIARGLIVLLNRRISQYFQRPSLTRMTVRGIRVGVFLLAGLTILRIFGLQLGDIALSVTVFSAVVGVVLAPIVGSIISGLFLLADQPYEIGDLIELSDRGQRGFVEDITLRYTKVFTLDNTFLVIPNGTMRDRDVINYSAEDARTRQSLQVVVTYESDIMESRDVIETAARSVDSVIEGGPDIRIGSARYPAGPMTYIEEFGDHGIHITLRYWATEPYRLLAVRSKIQTAIWEAAQDADMEMAYPHSHLVFDETSGTLRVTNENGESPADGESSPNPPLESSASDRDDES